MGWPTKFSKTQIAEALNNGQQTRVVNNGWIRLDSSTSRPTNLGTLVTPGNYITSYWKDGPSLGDEVISPLKIVVTVIDGKIHQYINAAEKKFHRMMLENNDIYCKWNILTNDGAINPGPIAPIVPISGKTLWLDTSNPNTPSLKIYMNGVWKKNIINETITGCQSVCYGNDKFVAIANNKSVCVYSYDGITWHEVKISDTAKAWYCVCYGDDKFVAVAYNSNTFAYSYDGITWFEGTISDTLRDWRSVCYGDDKFVAVAYKSDVAAYSFDGITWIEISVREAGYRSVCYGNGIYVATTYNNITIYSTDGINWTSGFINDYSSGKDWFSVCYGDDKFVAIPYKGNIIAYSINGISWEVITVSDTDRIIYSVCYGDDKFVAIPSENSTYFYSADGITWYEDTFFSSGTYWRSVCYGDDKFVAVASSYCAHAESSSWKEIIPEGSMNREVYDSTGKRTDIFKYIDDAISNASLENIVETFNTHINDTAIHTSNTEKAKWNTTPSTNDLDNAVNTMKSTMKNITENSVNANINKANTLLEPASKINNDISSHANTTIIHPSPEKQTEWDNKADGGHEHKLDNRVTINISNINGTIPNSLLPYDVKERAYVVSSLEEMYQLQKNPVHNGDLICVESGNKTSIYFVINDTYLGTASAAVAFKEVTVNGTLNWESVLEKPTTIEEFGIEDAATNEEIDNISQVIDTIDVNPVPHDYSSAVATKSFYDNMLEELRSIDSTLPSVLEEPVSTLEEIVGKGW